MDEVIEKPKKRKPYVDMSAGEIVCIFLILLSLWGTWKLATFYYEYNQFKANAINAVNALDKKLQGK